MSHFTALISPSILRALGWALVHFLWEGVALAALFAAASTLCRTASARYVLGVGVLAAMLAAPVITFTQLLPRATNASVPTVAVSSASRTLQPNQVAAIRPVGSAPTGPAPVQQSGALLWFVEAWFAGVVFLSLRAAGGFFAIESMRRRESKPVSAQLLEKCLSLQRRLRLDRVILYCECRRLDAPAVIGWFRPIVMLPMSALTGLSEKQLEAVIAHELAHIRRFDSFINLFQIAAETLLFYHPAVWWVSKRVRDERENCCDDVAISVCGDAVNYARALTMMEEWRSAPSLAMAANRGPLASRVTRLLGISHLSGGTRSAGFVASFACLAGALFAGNAFVGVAHNFFGYDGVPASAHLSIEPPNSVAAPASSSPIQHALARATSSILKAATSRVLASAQQEVSEQQSTSTQSAKQSGSSSYIEQMAAAGYDNLTVEQLISLKTQGVTPEYVKAIHDLGLKPSVDELIGMKVQGISPEYIRDMRAAGTDVDMNHLIGMKVQGISPEYIRDMRAAGADAKIDQLIGMKVQGITPEYVKAIHDLGLQPSVDELIGMKVQGITPEYIRDMRAAGVDTKTDRLIGMKVQGITPEYVKAMHDQGIQPDSDELIGMKVQGISPEYIRDMRSTGLNASADQLIGMRVQGVTPEFVQALKKSGLPDFKDDPDNFIAAKVSGITPEFIQKVQSHGFKDIDLDKLIALKNAGIF